MCRLSALMHLPEACPGNNGANHSSTKRWTVQKTGPSTVPHSFECLVVKSSYPRCTAVLSSHRPIHVLVQL